MQFLLYFCAILFIQRLPSWLRGKEPTCQLRRCGFIHWVGIILWSRKWHEKSHQQRSLMGYSSWGHKRVRYDLGTKQQHSFKTFQSSLQRERERERERDVLCRALAMNSCYLNYEDNQRHLSTPLTSLLLPLTNLVLHRKEKLSSENCGLNDFLKYFFILA